MPGQPAARVGDTIACPVPQATPAALPHAPPPGLPILPPGCPTVLIGGKPAARLGDQSMCIAPAPAPNPIIKGAFPVPIGNKPAARMTDSGAHPGSMITPPCCPTVLIGLAGTTGNVQAGTAMCEAAKQGRNGGGNGQSYNNCGVESSRQLINQGTGANLGEDALLTWAKNNPSLNVPMANGQFPLGPPGTPNAFAHGGTFPSTQAGILTQNGLPATVQSAANPANIQNAMMNGQGVIANVDAAALWPTTAPNVAAPNPGAWHAVTVTGIEYDDAGNIKNYIINDTGTGQCGVVVDAATFENAMGQYHTPGNGLVVTNNPIW